MRENIDGNVGTVFEGLWSLRGVGETISRKILDVASGKPTKAVAPGHNEQFCIARLL